MSRKNWIGLSLLLAAHAGAQPELYGIRTSGELVYINRITGSAAFIAQTGVMQAPTAWGKVCCFGNQGIGWRDSLVIPGTGADASRLVQVAIDSGTLFNPSEIANFPAGHTINGMASLPSGVFVLLDADDPAQPDLLARLEGDTTQTLAVVGSTGRTDVHAMASDAVGILFAIAGQEAANDAALYQLDTLSGTATLIGGAGTYGADIHALARMPDGTFFAVGSNLRSVNTSTGTATVIGPTGFTDVRGLAVGTSCYADCNQGPPPQLNVLDFNCYLNSFNAGIPYANCDRSTAAPVLNVLDFNCFLNKFAGGCQ